MIVDNDLLSMQNARILAETAAEGQKSLAAFPQEKLDTLVKAAAHAVEMQAEELAVMAHGETDCGRWQDKLFKLRFLCGPLLEQLLATRCVGVLSEDKQQGLMNIGVPVGVVAALSPMTAPLSATVHAALMALKSGNAVIFSPHPRAARSIARVVEIMADAARVKGLPEGCLSCLSPASSSGACELLSHPHISLILNNGVPSLLAAARGAGKALIYGGTGQGPAFIERTADIAQAARDIVCSKAFDNGMAVSAEHSVVVDACIAGEARAALEQQGCYFLPDEHAELLAELITSPVGKGPGVVGIAAPALAKRAGFTVPATARVLMVERKYVRENDPFAREILAPVLSYYVEDDWLHACEKCIELLLLGRSSHTLVIHSKDEEVIRQFALKKPVGRLLVNTPAVFGGMGYTTRLTPSLTLGSGSAGQGITADNVSPLNFIYTRKVGYGLVPPPAEVLGRCATCTTGQPQSTVQSAQHGIKDMDVETLRHILQKVVQSLDTSGAR